MCVSINITAQKIYKLSDSRNVFPTYRQTSKAQHVYCRYLWSNLLLIFLIKKYIFGWVEFRGSATTTPKGCITKLFTAAISVFTALS